MKKKINPKLKFKLTNLQMFADEDFSGGDEPEDYVPTTMEELGGMIGTIAEQTIREVTAEDKLSVFDKMAVDNGDTIEQVVVKMASPRAYDEEGSNALTRKTPDIVVRLFKNWKRETYDTTVDISKMRKVLGKEVEGAPHEVMLVIDATTGQNGVLQASSFADATGVDSIILTKMDGTSKGGIILSIREELGIPVKYVGVGEKIDDLVEFDLENYIYGLCNTMEDK